MNVHVSAQSSANPSSGKVQTHLGALWRPALRQALVKLDPRQLVRSPVMLVVELTAAATKAASAEGELAKFGKEQRAQVVQ